MNFLVTWAHTQIPRTGWGRWGECDMTRRPVPTSQAASSIARLLSRRCLHRHRAVVGFARLL
ncbi:hypothetical protein PJN36_28520, partial [Mycobacterium kansasii]